MTDNESDLDPLEVPRPWAVDPALAREEPAAPAHNVPGAVIAALVIAMLIAGITGFAVTSRLQTDTPFDSAATSPTFPNNPTTPNTPNPPAPSALDPDASVLRSLGVQQQEVGATYTVGLIDGGDQVVGQTTLDLCNGTFPSESGRTARFQVLESNAGGDAIMSTESVLYHNPAAADAAFADLRRVRAECPHTPVASKSSGGNTVTTTFLAPPDTSWPLTPQVDRLAYEFDSVDLQGNRERIDHRVPAPGPGVDGRLLPATDRRATARRRQDDRGRDRPVVRAAPRRAPQQRGQPARLTSAGHARSDSGNCAVAPPSTMSV